MSQASPLGSYLSRNYWLPFEKIKGPVSAADEQTSTEAVEAAFKVHNSSMGEARSKIERANTFDKQIIQA